MPAVEALEKAWGSSQRKAGAQRTAFCQRKVILDEISCQIKAGVSSDIAIKQLEALRGSKSLYMLSNILKQRQKEGRTKGMTSL